MYIGTFCVFWCIQNVIILIYVSEKNIEDMILNPERREFLKDLWSGKYGADLSMKHEFEEDGSFRKLCI